MTHRLLLIEDDAILGEGLRDFLRAEGHHVDWAVRLLDARGRWGSEDSPIGAGDLKYDLAKLRHSLCGGYDFIVNDLFDLHLGEDGATLDWQLARQAPHLAVGAQFDALVAQHRRFVKPLRYDARSAAAFPNVLLLDAGPLPLPLHIISAFMPPKERAEKERVVRASGVSSWLWWSAEAMPALPDAVTSRSH